MAKLRVGFHSPYFGSTLGGGERYLCVTACTVRDRFPDAAVEIVSPVLADRALNERRLGVDLSGIELVATNRRVTPAHRFLNSVAALRPLRNRVLAQQAARFTDRYDVFLPMAYAIRVPPRRGPGAILCQFPYQDPGPELEGYQLVVCYSEYVRRWVGAYWDRDAAVVNPPVEVPGAEPDWDRKDRVILSVGRFFRGGHSKRQDLLVRAFRDLAGAGLEGWELHLAGSVHRPAGHAGFYEEVAAAARGLPIFLHPDAPADELEGLFARASIYWHAAGFGDASDPASAEHFGMTTVEAMARGAVPVVYGRGGQLEVVRDGAEGFLWTDTEQLARRTRQLATDGELRSRMGRAARSASLRFGRPRFEAEMARVLEPVLERAAREADHVPLPRPSGGTSP